MRGSAPGGVARRGRRTRYNGGIDPADLLDLGRYPVTDLTAPAAAALVAQGRAALAAEGVVVLPGFLRADALPRLVAECDALASVAHHARSRSTPYLAPPDPSYGEGHPRTTLVQSSVAAVAYDLFPPASALRALYEWDPLLHVVAALLGHDVLYRYADPFGALNVAVMREGDELGWHFDMTDFVVSLAIQTAEAGGDFENAMRIRAADDERYDAVAAVLRGDTAGRVRTEPMTPGTLMLFAGRTSLHRVTPVHGTRPRYVALLAYDTVPGTDSTPTLKRTRYGRLPGEPVPTIPTGGPFA